MVVCWSCGEESPDGFAYCGHCGTKLEASPEAEQRRLCTIVFCDLTGFTQRSESLDPEDVRQFLLPYYELMTEEVTRHGGVIDKLYGDGAMAVFGVPTAHEDDPERAIRASLRVLERLPSLGLDLEARIGINTGEVVVSTDHAARGDALTGDIVNTASRMQSAAPVGGVVVGEPTYEATRHVFDFLVLDPVELKGKAEPVPIFQPTAPIAAVNERVLEPTPFVGRNKELAALIDAFQRARADEPTFLSIIAEPGMGKSRLVREFARYIDGLPDLVTWRQGRCLPYGEGISFWALGEIVKTHAGILDTDDQPTISAKLDKVLTEPDPVTKAWIKDRLAPLVGLASTTAPPERGELFTAWRRFFTQLASAEPLVLVIEDLHWADEGLVAFLRELRSKVAAVPILVLATARPEVAERTPGWLDGTEIRLQALEAAPMRELVVAALSGASDELVDAVCERASGSPLYAEQLAAMRRMLPIAGGSDDDLPIPPTIQALLDARIDLLSPELLATLLDASVVGKTFWTGAVATVGTLDRATADERLRSLAEREFIREEPVSTIEAEREYSFAHALMHDVAYGRLSRRPRFAKHRATAGWIVDRVGRPMGEVAEIVVAHLDQAKEAAIAARLTTEIPAIDSSLVDALTDAATNAKRTDVPTAVRLIERALPLVEDDDARQPTVAYTAADIASNAGDVTRILELTEAAMPGLREAQEWDRLGEMVRIRGEALRQVGDHDAGRAVLEAGSRELASHPGPGLVAVLTDLAWLPSQYGETAEGTALLEQAERAADDAGLPRPPKLAALLANSEPDPSISYRKRRLAAEQALSEGDPSMAAEIFHDMGSGLQEAGTLEEALTACEDSIAIVDERGLDPMLGHSIRVGVLRGLGRWDEMVAESFALIEIANDLGKSFFVEGLWLGLARVLLDRGRPDLIDQERFEPANWSIGNDPLLWVSHLRLHALAGDVDLTPVRELIDADNVIWTPPLAELLIELESFDSAERYLAMPARDGWGDPGSDPVLRVRATWAEGLLSLVRGEWAQADAALMTVLERQRRIGSVYGEAGLLTWLARCAIGSRNPRLARERLTASRALWVSMGANARIAEVDDVLSVVS